MIKVVYFCYNTACLPYKSYSSLQDSAQKTPSLWSPHLLPLSWCSLNTVYFTCAYHYFYIVLLLLGIYLSLHIDCEFLKGRGYILVNVTFLCSIAGLSAESTPIFFSYWINEWVYCWHFLSLIARWIS